MMGLQEMQKLTGGQLYGADATFNAVSIDTRTLQAGELFIAISGDNFNGNSFVNAAVEKQAVAAIITEKIEVTVPTLQVEDSRIALGKLGASNRQLSDARVIALTGSQGKTTVKEMTANILAHCGEVLKTKGNLNNDYGVPLTLIKLEEKHQFAVIELGANGPGEIAYISELTKPHVVHITNIAPTHLEGFGDLDGVAKAKGEIWESMSDDGIAVLNLDDAYGGQWMEKLKGRSFVSISALGKANADFKVTDLKFDEAMHTTFSLISPQGAIEINLPLPGQHNVANALAAAALSIQVGANVDEVKKGLESMQAVDGRMQTLAGLNNSTLIDDSYNASPSSFQAAIDVLAQHEGLTIVAMGEMGELGNEEQKAHEDIGLYAKAKGIDFIFSVGDLTELTVKGFAGDGEIFSDLDALAQHIKPLLNQQVKVLIKGSRSSGMDKLVQLLKPVGD
ncbi:MAG: UDP-N-acetylmuramoyl-tripeptide--D-alanyl-D-alanine ligase [Gammaproteobacteria bacterium]|jgi:UDP-N-acetylmuramoyl-tripeptide--D-alanyl-D-alanine ligase|nr:UDP-N-acetylmuramoyl-tripeptide--D-alanyl-D-alanine ligase [Gammaproteobacteria bacterium]